MSNRKIDLLDRETLIKIGIKLQINGYTNRFTSPYLKKDEIKRRILDFFKQNKKIQRRNSFTGIENIQQNKKLNTHKSLTNLRAKVKSQIRNENQNQNQNNLDLDKYLLNIQYCYPKVPKIVAIGDIHGDLSVAIKSLKLAGVISMKINDNIQNINNVNWTGGNTFVVQLGDQIDRVRPEKLHNNLCLESNDICEDEGSDLKIISLFERLHEQAQKQGGAILSILGNHELMNVDQDFRYVSPKEFREFGNFFNGKLEKNSEYPYGYKERLEAFKPGGILSKKLALTRFSIVQVGSWVFVHGGITKDCAKDYSLKEINYYVRKWLYGDESPRIMNHIEKLYHNDNDEYSPFWSRKFSDLDEWCENECLQEFIMTLNNLNIKNLKNSNNMIKGMIMGHSPQFMYNKCINSSANNRLWRVDIGASRAFGKVDDANRAVQVLVIKNDNEFSILREK